MDPITVQNPIEVFTFEELPSEVKLAVLRRFDLPELLNYSQTNRANHQFVWMTPDLLDRIITLNIIKMVQPFFRVPKLSDVKFETLKWRYTTALAKVDLNQAIQFAKTHLSTCLQVTSLQRISEEIKDQPAAINTLLLAANICKEDISFDRTSEFLRNIVRQLAPLDSENAFQVLEMIDDEKEKLTAKAEIAQHLPYGHKNEVLQEVVQSLMSTSIHQYRYHRILYRIANDVSFTTMKKLLEKAQGEYIFESDSNIYYDVVSVGIKSYYNYALRSHPEDHHWIFWLIEKMRDTEYLVKAYSYLASLIFKIDPRLAQELIEKAKGLIAQNPNDGDCYKNIAEVLALWDIKSAEEFYEKAIDTLFASLQQENSPSIEININQAIRGLATLNLELALSYNEKIEEEKEKACNLLQIALNAKKIDLLEEATHRLLNVPEGVQLFTMLASHKILKFGEDFAVASVRKIKDPEIRGQELMKLSKRMLCSNPQRTYQIAKEGISIALQFKKSFKIQTGYLDPD